MHLWQLAQEHMNKAQISSDPVEMQQAIAAVVMAGACLEAYINAVLSEQLHWSDDKLREKTLEGKWEAIAQEFGQPFDKGMRPFQDLHWLVDLRNYVLHYKYKPKFTEPVQTKAGRVPEVRARLNKAASKRAVETCRTLVTELCRRRRIALPSWLSET